MHEEMRLADWSGLRRPTFGPCIVGQAQMRSPSLRFKPLRAGCGIVSRWTTTSFGVFKRASPVLSDPTARSALHVAGHALRARSQVPPQMLPFVGRMTPRAYSGLRTRAYWEQTHRGCSVMLFGVNGNKERLILTLPHPPPRPPRPQSTTVAHNARPISHSPGLSNAPG